MRKKTHGILWLLLLMAMSTFAVSAAGLQAPQRRDSVQRRAVPAEVRSFRSVPLMSSPLPVTIRQQGRQLCVTSRYNQLLPIYSANGTYYSAFRLAKGTNWLTGLPRGGYIINNKRYVIN